jgi:pimeloyl-ACP methyl ester carboxylesterase
MFQHKGFATILIDLLTTEEESIDMVTRHLRFDIPLLARRVVAATHWLRAFPETKDMKIAYFGASTGAAAALVAAAELPEHVMAVVSRGGRPDLAKAVLGKVKSPTLLIDGGNDSVVIDLNRTAMDLLQCQKSLVIVPRAGHLFEQPGKLERVAEFAEQWFEEHLLGKKIMVGTEK